jgi:CelD/BcsL family acetyltransferase involved in cellulose biosynthesis
MYSDSYARFVAATLDEFGAGGGRRIFALKVNGALVAAQLDSVDRVRVESFVGAYDESFSRYSPGSLLLQECIRWAFERDLDYDHRLGAEPFKLGLATHVQQVTTYALALTPRGKLFLAYIVARSSGFGNRLELLRYRSKSWLRRAQCGASLEAK